MHFLQIFDVFGRKKGVAPRDRRHARRLTG